MHFLPEIFSDRGPKPQNRDPILRRPQKPRYPKKQGFTWWWMVKMMVWLTRWWKCRPWQPSIIRKFLANFPLISCLLIFHRSAGGKQKRQTHQRWKSDRRIRAVAGHIGRGEQRCPAVGSWANRSAEIGWWSYYYTISFVGLQYPGRASNMFVRVTARHNLTSAWWSANHRYSCKRKCQHCQDFEDC